MAIVYDFDAHPVKRLSYQSVFSAMSACLCVQRPAPNTCFCTLLLFHLLCINAHMAENEPHPHLFFCRKTVFCNSLVYYKPELVRQVQSNVQLKKCI